MKLLQVQVQSMESQIPTFEEIEAEGWNWEISRDAIMLAVESMKMGESDWWLSFLGECIESKLGTEALVVLRDMLNERIEKGGW